MQKATKYPIGYVLQLNGSLYNGKKYKENVKIKKNAKKTKTNLHTLLEKGIHNRRVPVLW